MDMMFGGMTPTCKEPFGVFVDSASQTRIVSDASEKQLAGSLSSQARRFKEFYQHEHIAGVSNAATCGPINHRVDLKQFVSIAFGCNMFDLE